MVPPHGCHRVHRSMCNRCHWLDNEKGDGRQDIDVDCLVRVSVSSLIFAECHHVESDIAEKQASISLASFLLPFFLH